MSIKGRARLCYKKIYHTVISSRSEEASPMCVLNSIYLRNNKMRTPSSNLMYIFFNNSGNWLVKVCIESKAFNVHVKTVKIGVTIC